MLSRGRFPVRHSIGLQHKRSCALGHQAPRKGQETGFQGAGGRGGGELQELPLLPRGQADVLPPVYKEAQRFWQTQAGSCGGWSAATLGEASAWGGFPGGSLRLTPKVHSRPDSGPRGRKGQQGPVKSIEELSPGSVSWAHHPGRVSAACSPARKGV